MFNSHPDINVRPLTDMAFNLMICFAIMIGVPTVIIGTTIEKSGPQVEISTSETAGEESSSDEEPAAATLLMNTDGSISWNGESAETYDLPRLLEQLKPGSMIQVNGHRAFDESIPILVILQQSGMQIKAGG